MLPTFVHLVPILSVFPLALAGPLAPAGHSVKRQSTEGTYTYTGCWNGSTPNDVAAYSSVFTGFQNNSPELCYSLCTNNAPHPDGVVFTYLFVSPNQCVCSSAGLQQDGITDAFCQTPCPGNSTETCGENAADGTAFAYSGYHYTPAPPPPPPPTWHDIGCYQDLVLPGILHQQVHINLFDNTIEKCQATCHSGNFTYAGLESGILCSCGNTLTNNKTAPAGDCNTPCSGNHTETCGGILFRAHLYEYY